MPKRTPLAELILTRMQELGLDRQDLGFRLGYQNPLKAAGRVYALCDRKLSPKSKNALRRLPEAIEVPPEVVERAVMLTEQLLAEMERQAEEQRRLDREKEEADWRAAFRPHAIIQTERTVPSQITFCGFTGGTERWLTIRFDLSKPPITFIQQALDALPEKAPQGQNGRRYVTFFGEALGLIINYSPDKAVRCDLDGQPLEVLSEAYRPGEVSLSFGGKPVSPTVIARVLGTI